MAQQLIQNSESGLDVRNALNGMFTEIYGLLSGQQPIKIQGASGNLSQAILANTYVVDMQIRPLSGTPTLRVGLTPNGQEIMVDTVINDAQPVVIQLYFSTAGLLYFTWTSGIGQVNIRINIISNYN